MCPKTLTTQENTQQNSYQQFCLDARNQYPITKHHTPPPKWRDNTGQTPGVASGPNSVPAAPPLLETQKKDICCCAPGARHYSNTPLHGSHPPNGDAFVVLLRKEVIQPHLPVRLPCYDFVPIADPTFDSSPHKGWATGFGCYRLS